MTGLAFDDVSHAFGPLKAVDGMTLEVERGELVCLLGPSGCGKTTALRVAAGLEHLQQGRVRVNGRTVAEPGRELAPEARGVGLVFQDFALFPHLSVRDNVAFGLRGLDAAERRRRVDRVLAQVDMVEQSGSWPHTLSGGQQQRIALARALAPRPRVMLLDEPFSGLDSSLRNLIRDQTLHVLKESGAATLMVTHDPEEAMFMADRIALMRGGRLVQVGRPTELYFSPADAFVAGRPGRHPVRGACGRVARRRDPGRRADPPGGPVAGAAAQRRGRAAGRRDRPGGPSPRPDQPGAPERRARRWGR